MKMEAMIIRWLFIFENYDQTIKIKEYKKA